MQVTSKNLYVRACTHGDAPSRADLANNTWRMNQGLAKSIGFVEMTAADAPPPTTDMAEALRARYRQSPSMDPDHMSQIVRGDLRDDDTCAAYAGHLLSSSLF